MRFYILTALCAAAVATPLEPRAASPKAFCAAVNSLVTKAKAQSTASVFCSSYLSIPTSTTTTTATATAIVSVTVTSTTVTSTVSSTTTTTTETTTITSTSSNIGGISCYTGKAKAKRAAATPVAKSIAKPACLSAYGASLLSTACKCLSIPTPLSTATVTSTTTSTTFSTVNVETTVSASTTFTETSTVTETTSTSVDLPGFYVRTTKLPLGPERPQKYLSVDNSQLGVFTSDTPNTLFAITPFCELVVVSGSGTPGNVAIVPDFADANQPTYSHVSFKSSAYQQDNKLSCQVNYFPSPRLECRLTDPPYTDGDWVAHDGQYWVIGGPDATLYDHVILQPSL